MNPVITQALTETQSNLRTIIGAYVTWYTAFWTLNAIALAWIFAKTRYAHEDHDRFTQRIVAVFFGLMNFCAVGTSIAMRCAMQQMSLTSLPSARRRQLPLRNRRFRWKRKRS
jgi:hypothetical protein